MTRKPEYSREILELAKLGISSGEGVMETAIALNGDFDLQWDEAVQLAHDFATGRRSVTDPATAAQLRYLAILKVEIPEELSKQQASLMIDAAKSSNLGSIGGFYTDGSN